MLILGSTGSIGTQALDVIAANPDRFEVVGLAAGGGNPDLLARQRAETGVTNIAVADDAAAAQVGDVTYAGPDAVTRLVENTEADVVLNALVGALGLKPTLAALATGARLALANKESLVAGGPLVLKAAKPGQIVPVDSEHSAMAQCLRGGTADEVAKIVLTASGGPFRGWTAERLEDVTPEQAGAHPTWSMGPMNTLNSASLVNKGLELIETHLLFGVPYDRIEVVVHPQSIVHSMVTFTDGSTLAQASPPDMKLPIALALGWPDAGPRRGPGLRLHHRLDLGVRAARRRRCSRRSSWRARPGRTGGCLTAVYNAANEEAAAAFLDGPHPVPGDRANDRRGPARCRPVGRRTRYRGRRTRCATLGPRPGKGRSIPGGRHHQMMMWIIGVALFALCHPGVGGAARMRAHVGGARHRDEGAPLLRRLRPDAVVDASAQQARLHRVRRQGGPARRLLRHRGHDRDRRDRARGPALRDVPAEDVEAGRWCCSPGPAMNFVIGLVLIYGIALIWGLPNLHPQPAAVRQRNLLCRTGTQQGPDGQVRRESDRRRPRASSPATSSSRSATPT